MLYKLYYDRDPSGLGSNDPFLWPGSLPTLLKTVDCSLTLLNPLPASLFSISPLGLLQSLSGVLFLPDLRWKVHEDRDACIASSCIPSTWTTCLAWSGTLKIHTEWINHFTSYWGKQKIRSPPQGVQNLTGKTSPRLRRVHDLRNTHRCQPMVPAVDFVQERERSELGQSEKVWEKRQELCRTLNNS